MTEPSRSDRADASADPAGGTTGYEGPGGWGTTAMALLVGLFLVSVGLTVHSLVATFGG